MAMAKLRDKDQYHQLTPKQKAIIDAKAENPDAGPTELAEIATEKMEDGSVSRSYIHPILTEYSDIAEKQIEIKANKRENGTEKTVGDPFEKLDSQLNNSTSGSWQMLSERPKQDTLDVDDSTEDSQAEASEDTQSRQSELSVDLTPADLVALLSGEVPPELRQELLRDLVSRAFEDGGSGVPQMAD